MCGIAGTAGRQEFDPELQRDEVLGMLGMIRHRGPDQFGVYQDDIAALGSARLSIIDLSGGQQPIGNEDGSLWIVYNGEVFNYLELRPGLEQRGHRFTTNTDTEVLLHLYEEYGPECLRRLNGQFAAAIWDSRRRTLFLARDRMGIRPLFYIEREGRLLFASEVKALLACRGVSASLDPESLDQVFTYWSTLAGRTAFKGIRELEAGHYLLYRDGRSETHRWWDFSFHSPSRPARDVPAGEHAEELESLIVDAALIRLRSDVPVGAYLSGGLDSSLIAHTIATRTSNKLATFSIAFDDPDFDESGFQLRMAESLGTRHEVLRVTHGDIGRAFPRVVWHTETPMTRSAPVPMFLLSGLVRDSGFKVVLTGEGADEILAGYDIFKEAAIRRFAARHPESKLRPLLFQRLYPDITALHGAGAPLVAAFFQAGDDALDSPYYSHAIRWRNGMRARRFFSRELRSQLEAREQARPALPSAFSSWDPLERAQYLEATVFLRQYLLSSQGDRVAMAHSVESRLPFLDYRVVEFANRLPASLKLRVLEEKHILRRIGRKFLPAELWQRPKRPYRAPIHSSFFADPAPDYVNEMLSPAAIDQAGCFDHTAVERLAAKARRGQPLGETDEMALAGILSTQLVHQQFVAHFRRSEPVKPGVDDVKIVWRHRVAAAPGH